MTSRSFKRPFISKSRRPARARVTSLAAYVRSNPTFTSTFQPGGQAEQLQARERALRVDARHASHFGGAGEPGGDQGSSAKPVLQTPADLPVAQGQDSDNSSDLDRVSRAMVCPSSVSRLRIGAVFDRPA